MKKNEGEKKQGLSAGRRRRALSTVIFFCSLIAILLFALFLSRIDHPPLMPNNPEHQVGEKEPNDICLSCHTANSLPDQHPLDYEKFQCTRCHLLEK
ncbi:MAG: hypothetical protein JXR83_22495 [Deltaproteobacteria bacterium]|nr:hypothetical protein [Deltaproteobacteria bacterium]